MHKVLVPPGVSGTIKAINAGSFTVEETIADYQTTQLTLGPHPMSYWRERLHRQGVTSTAGLNEFPHGARVRMAGSVIVRQRPGCAHWFSRGHISVYQALFVKAQGGPSGLPLLRSDWYDPPLAVA